MISRHKLLDASGHLTDRAVLLSLDGELPANRRSEIEIHLARCASCRSRLGLVKEVEEVAQLDVRLRTPTRAGATRRVRAGLEAHLNRAIAGRRSTVRTSPRWSPVGRWVYGAAACLAVLMLGQTFQRAGLSPLAGMFTATVEAAALPVAAFTPGAVEQITAGRLCASADRPDRTVARDVRDQVLASYRMTRVSPSEYELDYLVTPELGGANDRRNLWPQRYLSEVWNARVKDDLESLLPRLVCSGEVDLASAQRDIADNWIAAYKKYFRTSHPLPPRGVDADPEDNDAPVIVDAMADRDAPIVFVGDQARVLFDPTP